MRRVLIGAGGRSPVRSPSWPDTRWPGRPTPTWLAGPDTRTEPGPDPSAAADGSATGPRIETDYGPVQVRVTVTGGAIVDIEAMVLPSHHERSRWIAANLVPRLRRPGAGRADRRRGRHVGSDVHQRRLSQVTTVRIGPAPMTTRHNVSLMGTVFSFCLMASAARARRAIEAATAELEAVDRAFSPFATTRW